jgi:hypothetical protein
MPLSYGSKPPVEMPEGVPFAVTGMSAAIFAVMDELMAPPLQQAVADASEDAKPAAQDALEQARHGWKKLSYAIAQGVIEHIKANMEIQGIQSEIDVGSSNRIASGDTDPADSHTHPVSIPVAGTLVVVQSDDGTNHVS